MTATDVVEPGSTLEEELDAFKDTFSALDNAETCERLAPVMLGPFARALLAAIRGMEQVAEK